MLTADLRRLRVSLIQGATVLIVSLVVTADICFIVSGRVPPLWAVALILANLAVCTLLTAGAAGKLRRLLLALILLEIPFQIDINLGWSLRAARFNAIAGFNISLTTLILLFLYAWWSLDILSKRLPPPNRAFWRAGLPSVAYLVAVTVSLLMVRSFSFGLFGLNLVVQALLLYFYALNFIRSREDIRFISYVLLLSLLLQSMILVTLAAAGRTIDIGIVSSGHVDARGRPGGTLASPNVAGSYLALLLLAAFSLLATPEGRWSRRLAAVAVGCGGLALLATGSRGAWGGLAVGGGLFCLLTCRRRWLSLKIPVGYLTIALALAALFFQQIMERLAGARAVAAAESRGPLMTLALRMIRDHPLFGVGVNNFVFHLSDYVTAEFATLWVTTVHNKYLLVWAESGLLGLLTFLWFLLATLYTGWRVWQQRDRRLSPLALALTLALVGWMLHMTVELFNSRIQLMMLWFTAAILTAMQQLLAEPGSSQVPEDEHLVFLSEPEPITP